MQKGLPNMYFGTFYDGMATLKCLLSRGNKLNPQPYFSLWSTSWWKEEKLSCEV